LLAIFFANRWVLEILSRLGTDTGKFLDFHSRANDLASVHNRKVHLQGGNREGNGSSGAFGYSLLDVGKLGVLELGHLSVKSDKGFKKAVGVLLLIQHAGLKVDNVFGNMFVKLFKDIADLLLLCSDSSAIAKDHLAEMDNAVVVVFTEAKSATASVALHGGVGAILFQVSFHLLAFNFGNLACVTDNQLLNASLLVACFVRSSERSNAAIVCAIDDAVLALCEQMVSKVSVLDSFNVAAFNGAVK
jgi:hypothetical protein